VSDDPRPTYDLLIQGGLVIDPAQGLHARRDVAVAAGRVAAVAEALPPERARRVVDVGGCIVTPGLIDLHTHLYRGVSTLGVDVDRACLPGGVTTSVDAGTAGAITFPGLRDYCLRPARSRAYAYVNLAAIGLILDDGHELDELRYADADSLAETIQANRDLCLGIKVRVGEEHVGSFGYAALDRALAVAERIGCGVMVHITRPGVPLDGVFDRLRPGDVITHLLHGKGETIVRDGRVLASVRRARERGVGMDVGHGMGSFAFATARAALADGFAPLTISTDLHAFNVNGPVYDLATTLSKFLALGMSLDAVVAAATSNAARSIGKQDELGSLAVGRAADVAVFALREGEVVLVDALGETLRAEQRLEPLLTVLGGAVVASRLEGVAAEPVPPRG